MLVFEKSKSSTCSKLPGEAFCAICQPLLDGFQISIFICFCKSASLRATSADFWEIMAVFKPVLISPAQYLMMDVV